MYVYMPGDRVKYVGSGGSHGLTNKIGEVVGRVTGEPNGFVVDFGDDSYVIDGRNLAKHFFAPGSEPNQTRRRRDPDLD